MSCSPLRRRAADYISYFMLLYVTTCYYISTQMHTAPLMVCPSIIHLFSIFALLLLVVWRFLSCWTLSI